jgi:hypothetical protein
VEPTQPNPVVPTQPQPGAIVVPEINAVPVVPIDASPDVSAPAAAIEDDIADPNDNPEVYATDEPAFQWQASEYVQHNKGMGWYLALAGIVLALLAIAIFTQQWLSIAVFLVMAAAVVVYAHKPPRILLYQLDANGIVIEGKSYAYSQFRSFGVLPDLSWHTIDLEPTQRFMPRLTIIFDEEDFDSIVDHLSFHLPRVDRQPDLVERLTRFTRF